MDALMWEVERVREIKGIFDEVWWEKLMGNIVDARDENKGSCGEGKPRKPLKTEGTAINRGECGRN
jgi:hypothetical protein